MNPNTLTIGSVFTIIAFVFLLPLAFKWRNPGGQSDWWYFDLCFAGVLLIANVIAIIQLLTKKGGRIWQAGVFLTSSAVAAFGIALLSNVGPH